MKHLVRDQRDHLRQYWPLYLVATVFGPVGAVVVAAGAWWYYATTGAETPTDRVVAEDAKRVAVYATVVFVSGVTAIVLLVQLAT